MTLEWTSAEDVRARWIGPGLTAEDLQIETLLGDAEDTILREFPDLATRVARASGEDTSEGIATPLRRVVKVAARMVERRLRNPEGLRQTQEGAGPFQKSATFGGNVPGTMYLTDEDRAELGGHGNGAFTVDTMPWRRLDQLDPSTEAHLWP